MRIIFGTAGVPSTSKKRDSLSGIGQIANIGLDLMELEFVRGVKMGQVLARKVGELAKEKNVILTVHAPYYINLVSADEKIRDSSKKHILDSMLIGALCGAKSVTFHAAYYQKYDSKEVLEIVKTSLSEVLRRAVQLCNGMELPRISPELTGKKTQFGSLEDLVSLVEEMDGKIGLCIDFAHQHARDGNHNTYDEFSRDIEFIKSNLGEKFLKNLHIHVSGINYTAKGERNHLMLENSDLNYKELLAALIDKNIGGYMVCESPIQDKDALMLKALYASMLKK